MLPAFQRSRIEFYAEPTMTKLAVDLADSWKRGEVVEFDLGAREMGGDHGDLLSMLLPAPTPG
ncbi:hypothetical protein SD37_24580 [Amycolatopsis orientalis]|uniref:Uncharacterized protein n=1 Tax=Amycolatopsis orientalis TaxID=31958 RepID=A0A193C1Y4_AMYOR|nr:hypothetical protein SD37_24580 [Amycolatopsis orientalis]